jgi:hypothetical protein
MESRRSRFWQPKGQPNRKLLWAANYASLTDHSASSLPAARPKRYRRRVATTPTPLTEETLVLAVGELAARDPDLSGIVARFGPPPM